MLKDKYHALSSREQAILKIAIPIFLLLISWLIVIKPIINTDLKLKKSIAKKEQQLIWMHDNANKVSNITNTAQPAVATNKSQLRQLMNQLLKIHKISVERIQNINDNTVSYQLDNSQYNNILRLIKDLQDMGVSISQLQITKHKQLGKVNTRLAVAVGD